MIGGESFIIVANPALGVTSFAELVQLAKTRTAPLNMGSPGQATLGALVVEQLLRKPGLLPTLNHVPYRGGGPVMTDLLGNHVPVACERKVEGKENHCHYLRRGRAEEMAGAVQGNLQTEMISARNLWVVRLRAACHAGGRERAIRHQGPSEEMR